MYPVKYQFQISPDLGCGQHGAKSKTAQFVDKQRIQQHLKRKPPELMRLLVLVKQAAAADSVFWLRGEMLEGMCALARGASVCFDAVEVG